MTSVVTTIPGRIARTLFCMLALIVAASCSGIQPGTAAPFAAIVQDARTGEVLFAENADTRLHPASLTKMLTLYIAFQEIEAGRLSLDSRVTVSKNAASKPPSRLGLKAGQKVALRYLIRAAAVKSANDAASAIGDAIGGSEAAFARRMTATAKSLGMKNSTFKNANGLTQAGHLSTARDMNLLGRRLFYDFPQFYNIFARRTTDAGLAHVRNTNSRFLDGYEGADGIKTGYTVAAGFNLTASAQRGKVRLVATVFGGTSTAQRNAKMAELMNLGFRKAPANAPVRLPEPAPTPSDTEVIVAEAAPEAEAPRAYGKTIRVQMAVARSPRPVARRVPEATEVAQSVGALETTIAAAVAEAAVPPPPPDTLEAQAEDIALAEAGEATTPPEAVPEAPSEAIAEAVSAAVELAAAEPEPAPRPAPRPATEADEPEAVAEAPAAEPPPVEAPAVQLAAESLPETATEATPKVDRVELAVGLIDAGALTALTDAAEGLAAPETAALALVAPSAPAPTPRRAPIYDRVAEAVLQTEAEPVVIRLSTSNARHWGVHLGRFGSSYEAERLLLQTQLAESATLNDALRKPVSRAGGYDANFMGLTQEQADLACRRLQARGQQCFTIGP